MSHHVSATSNAAAGPAHTARAAAPRKGTGASFAEMHAAAVRSGKDDDAKTQAPRSAAKPKGEKTEKVDGHHYLEVVAGPRNGMFINMSDNSRNGQAFVMVKRDGREFHVYGTGDDRAVFEVGRRTQAPAPKPTTGPSTAGSTPATT
jgi:hypothetical protein